MLAGGSFFLLLFLSEGKAWAADALFGFTTIRAIQEPLPGKMTRVPVRTRTPGVFNSVLRKGQPRGLFESVRDPENPRRAVRRFVPCVWVEVKAREKMSSEGVFLKVYFYDEAKQVVAVLPVLRNNTGGLPALLEPEGTHDFFVPIPKELVGKKWNVVAVMGDAYEANAAIMDGHSLIGYHYPEKELVAKRGTLVKRTKVEDPVVSLVVKTNSRQQPVMTLFMRPPKGVSDYSEVRGVLCACLLANSPEEIKQMLLSTENPEFSANFDFADEHKLAIIAWGASRVWGGKNYSEQTREEVAQADAMFNEIANSWERGVKQLCNTYGLEPRNFLLWRICASGNWAARLALRKPDYFLAVHTHIPQNFDAPRPAANKPLWLLTTGELDSGYSNTVRFFQDAKRMNYPIIYRAVEGVGHGRSPITDGLGNTFFEYALSLRSARAAYDKIWNPMLLNQQNKPWAEGFKEPPFYADVINQISLPAEQVSAIPEGFRMSLPTQELAEAWSYKIKPAEQSAAEKRPPNAKKNLAKRLPVSSSNPSPTKHQNDGLTDGYWRHQFVTGDSPVFPKTMTIDLKKEANVSMVFVGIPTYSVTKTVAISVSRDGVDWHEVDSYEFPKGYEEQHLFQFEPTPTRYVRLVCPDHYGGHNRLAFSEVEVYAPEEKEGTMGENTNDANEKR